MSLSIVASSLLLCSARRMLPLRGLSGLSVKIFEDMWLGALGVGAGTGSLLLALYHLWSPGRPYVYMHMCMYM